jgi:hypothetical protein
LDLTDLLGGDIVVPLMILLAFLILIILVLLARASSPRKGRADDVDIPQVVYEIESEVLPPQEIIESETSPIVEEILTPRDITSSEIRPIVEEVLPPPEIIEPEIRSIVEEVLPPPEIIEPEIRPIVEEGESVDDFRLPPEEVEIKDDIRPLLQKGASDGCQYCSIFRDIGTAVCPNCGRPLNLRIILKES